MDSSHEFMDAVRSTMNVVVTWHKNAPTGLRSVCRMLWALEIPPLQYSSLGHRRWAAFATRAVVALQKWGQWGPMANTKLKIPNLWYTSRG